MTIYDILLCLVNLFNVALIVVSIRQICRKQPEALQMGKERAGSLAGIVFAIYVQVRYPR